MDARGSDGAEDGDGLAAELGDEDGDGGSLEDRGEPLDELGFELFHGEAACVEPADDGEVDIAAHIDTDGLVGHFFDIDDTDEELVIGAEDVGGGRLILGWLTLGGERGCGAGKEGGEEEITSVHDGLRGVG